MSSDPQPLSSLSNRLPARRALCATAALLALAGAAAFAQQRPDFDDWYSGALAFNTAIGVQANEGKPMLVYFYADWCNFCRQFENELLSDGRVADYLKDVIAVRMNPEVGDAERRFGAMYGVRGYPALFVHSGASKTLSRIDRMKVEDGKPRLMSPDEFIDTVREAATR